MQQPNKKTKKKAWYRHPVAIVFLGIPIAFIGLTTMAAVIYAIATYEGPINEESSTNTSQQKDENNQTSINYIQPKWEISSTETVGTTYIVATGYLVNQTEETGIADCNIEFYDREVKWAGGKGFGGQELEPGERYDFTVQVEVANTGLISKQNIDCEDGIY